LDRKKLSELGKLGDFILLDKFVNNKGENDHDFQELMAGSRRKG